jgi:hypothetical protein
MAKFLAVVDDSGSEPQSRIFVLAGFVGTPDDWAKFAPEWQAVLDLPPKLDYFKMTEAANLGGQFSRPRGWDESKRDDRVAALCSFIQRYSHLTVQAGVRNDYFAKYIKSIPAPERTLLVDSPYVLVFTQIILAMATYGDRVGIDDACQFVFDQQHGFDGYAKMAWSNMKALDDRFQESCHMGGIHLAFQAPIYAVEGFETKDLAIWRRGGGRLNCRSEIRMWRS